MCIYTLTKLKSHAQAPPPTQKEMAEQLGARDAFAEDPSLIPSTHVQQLTIASNSSFRVIRHLWPLQAPVFMCIQPHIDTQLGKIGFLKPILTVSTRILKLKLDTSSLGLTCISCSCRWLLLRTLLKPYHDTVLVLVALTFDNYSKFTSK